MTNELKLAWGYNKGLPRNCTAAWGASALVEGRVGGARALVEGRVGTYNVSLLYDRQSFAAPVEANATALLGLLNAGRIEKALREAERQLALGDIRSNERKHTELYRDDQVVIVANTCASCGYLYLAAYACDDEGCR